MNKSKKKQKLFSFLIVLCFVLVAAFVTPLLVETFTETVTKESAEATTEIVEEKNQTKGTEDTSNEQERTNNNTTTAGQSGKVVYLTFDDGPSSLTGRFLDILKEHGAKATFFMQGSNLKNPGYHENVKRVVEEGHYLGAHSMTHDSRKLYTNKQFVPEMVEAIDLIRNITNTNPKLVRAPYGTAPGLKNKEIRNQTAEAGLKVWDWTLDTEDWRLRGKPDKVIQKVKEAPIRNVEVVLMHEQSQTLEALPAIINYYKEKGYQFVAYNENKHFSLNFQNDERL
ncbi:peptidoglycan/xylan/chitin deacetylase (PgdA/CDA1 family) [Priestia taiwanensis]|nr:peptidoglycan/xylan/chitin deacetylase (PgdA/CDA1 family) [Priestia taiwanensis]